MINVQQTITGSLNQRGRPDVNARDAGSQTSGTITEEFAYPAAEHLDGMDVCEERPGAYLEPGLTEWKAAFPLKPGEQVRPLYGLFASDGHEVDRFLADKRREKAREDAIDAREAAASEQFRQ